MKNLSLLWAGRTKNRKTGDIPTAWVGKTRDESIESCEGCPIRDTECYAHKGAVAMAHLSMTKRATAKGLKDYSLKKALDTRSVMARYVRVSAIGDAARANPQEVREAHDHVRSIGLGWLAYTHFPEDVKQNGLQDLFCASTHTMAEADERLNEGFQRATVVAPWDTLKDGYMFRSPAGRLAIVCPAIAAHSKGKRLTCNQCGLCDPAKDGPKIILFPEHGTKFMGRLAQAAKDGFEWAKKLMEPM